MNISILAAGAAGMYCGSCLRDSAIAHALRNQGHHVTLIPLYTPLRNERAIGATGEVFYGGVNLYLKNASKAFRHSPRMLDWMFDRPWLLNFAGKVASAVPTEELAGLTVEILKGEDGAAAHELHRLTTFLRDTVKPEVICLPNVMFIGLAREFRERVGVPVICELTGEDIFLDAMRSEDRVRIRDIIRKRTDDVSRFVATSRYFAAYMAEFAGIPREQIDVIYTGLSKEYFEPPANSQNGRKRPLTIGYVGRACPEKGLGLLVEAMSMLRGMPNMWDVRLKVAGYIGPRDLKWYNALKKRAADQGMSDRIEWLGEVSIERKIQLLDSIDVFTMPTVMREPKGASIIEAMSRGVPVVQPAHGSFPELIELTGGGVLVEPNNAERLAEKLAAVLHGDAGRKQMSAAGKAAAGAYFTERYMANQMMEVFEATLAGRTPALMEV